MMGAEPAGKRLLAGTGRAAPLLSPGTNTFDARWNSLLSPRPRSKGFPGRTRCQQLPTVRVVPSSSAFGSVVLLLPGGAGCPGVQANLSPSGGASREGEKSSCCSSRWVFGDAALSDP